MSDIRKETEIITNEADRLRAEIPVDDQHEQRAALQAILFSVRVLARDLEIDLRTMED